MNSWFKDGSPPVNVMHPILSTFVEDECCLFSIAVSMDRFHESIPMENYLKYLTCGFYSDSKVSNMTDSQIIPRGRGMDVADGRNNRNISEMYLNVS